MLKIFEKEYSPTSGNTSLFVMVCFTVFFIPLLPVESHRIVYNLSYTTLFFMAVIAVDTGRKLILWGAIIATITEWWAFYHDINYVAITSYLVNLLFIIIIVGKMIYHITHSKIVNARVILEAINVYLLIGFIFSLLVTFLMIVDPYSYNFEGVGSADYYEVSHMSEYLYYAFVTFTTLGYGDIVPQTPPAKSLALWIAVTGQIYVAIILALLVGKFSSSQNEKN
jgi:hypothetical protein